MRYPITYRLKNRSLSQGFSLMEMMVAVSLLSLIVFGLYRMFDQTQRALRANNTQVDVLEGGRAAMDYLTREIQQAVAAGFLNPQDVRFSHLYARMDYNKPLLQTLHDGTLRTNLLQGFFFLTRPNARWQGNGFFVSASAVTNQQSFMDTNRVNELGVGTLYRFALPPDIQTAPFRIDPTNHLFIWSDLFNRAKSGSSSVTASLVVDNKNTNAVVVPVLENVVHFQLRPYNFLGNQMWTNIYPGIVIVNDIYPGQRQFYFQSNNLPSYLELEVGILEPQIYQRMKAYPGLQAQRNYLSNQVAAVHLFHKLIPLRNALP